MWSTTSLAELKFAFLLKLMGFLVFQRGVLCDSLKVALVEKFLFFLFAKNVLSVPFLRSVPFFLPTHSIEGDMAMSYTVFTLFFSKIKIFMSKFWFIVGYQGFWWVVSGKYDP